MSTFVYLFRNRLRSEPAADTQVMRKWEAWMKELGAQQVLRDPGKPIAPSGKVVKGKQQVVAQGPVTEAGDVVSGFLVVEARDIDHAIELSRGCPIFDGDGSVEVRPVMTF